MKDYMKPSLRENPDHFILHLGTNDTERSPELIAKSIEDLATTLKMQPYKFCNNKYMIASTLVIFRMQSCSSF